MLKTICFYISYLTQNSNCISPSYFHTRIPAKNFINIKKSKNRKVFKQPNIKLVLSINDKKIINISESVSNGTLVVA